MAVSAPAVLADQPHDEFEALYSAHQPRVYRTCLAILHNHDDAAEATQEVFSRALPLLTSLREPQVWLTTVARNYCFDQLRRQKVRGPGVMLDEQTPGSRRDDPERETMLRDALRQAFDALSNRERRALARVLLMDDSLGEIAEMLGVSYGAAAQVVSRARRRAALAARAVIGASFGWLARLTLPEQRSRVTRTAAQAMESGQHVLLAAVVVFTAGGLTRAEAVGPASVAPPSVVPIAPASAHAGAVEAQAVPSHVPALVVPIPSRPATALLPPGYAPGRISVSTSTPDNPQHQDVQPPPPPQPVTLHVDPAPAGCTGRTVSAGQGNTVVSVPAAVCPPGH